MKYILLLSVLLMTGCANTCTHACMFGFIGPGNKVFDRVGDHYNQFDVNRKQAQQ